MSPRTTSTLLRAGCALFGLLWLAAGVSKALAPEAAYEFVARILGGGAGAKAAVVAVAGTEAAFGAAMVLGVLRGIVPSAVALSAVSAALLHVRAQSGGLVGCGCFVVHASVDEALVRNAVLLALLLPLGVLAISERRSRSAAEDCDHATHAP